MAKMMISKRLKIVLLALLVAALAYFPVKMGLLKLAGVIELKNMVKTFDGDSMELQSTVILPALDSPMVAGKNNIWCSTFQLAWNELKDKEFKEPIRIADALELCDTLNNATQTKSDLLADSYFVDAGKVSDGVIQRIEAGMTAKFPSVELPEINPADVLIAYSYLETYIKFKEPFLQSEHGLCFTDSAGTQTAVNSFGVWSYGSKYKSIREQVEVLHCELNENRELTEFALDLCKYSESYQLVIAVTEQKESLAGTYDTLQRKMREFKSDPEKQFMTKLSEVDVLHVPDMFWEIEHHFAELEGKTTLNSVYNGMSISTALQGINFRLDRTGVILKSYALIAIKAMPRRFVCDKPFLIYLKKRDAAEPFFVMWVDNAELLRHYE